ncbi:hypothetical protein BKA70DRAFT_1294582 [Coprinopsis sp. MPI-PUGE-AT-0042]|nr:hypothetical protein BKA70DRAFT_1294582 [Coprinopsis sp. MPI-PUGE-AT-0042]
MLKHEDAASLVSVTRKSMLWQVAGSTVVFKTFDREIEFIWLGKWSFTTLLFVALPLVTVLSTGKYLDKVSPSVLQVQSWLSQIAFLAMNGIVVKRVVCMYSGDKRVLWALAVALAAFSVHSTTVIILTSNVKSVVRRVQSVYLYETCHIWPLDSIPSWYWTFTISMMVFDVLTERHGRRPGVGVLGHLWRTRRTLASVLLRDSILFPFINLILVMLVILLWTAKLNACPTP